MASYTLISCIDSRVENLTKFYGRFEIGPFAPGQALTVANALRRALLSHLSGTSITLLEIQGASNEYEILSGVRESILDILLNLKQVILLSDFEIISPQIGFLTVKGPGIVRARDLKLPPFISVVDPDQYIATLSSRGRLTMKFLICCGKNYITYNPSDSKYEKWLFLLQQGRTFNFLGTQKKAGFNLSLKKDPLSFFEKKKNPNLYKQWVEERAFLKKKNPFSKLKSKLDAGKIKSQKASSGLLENPTLENLVANFSNQGGLKRPDDLENYSPPAFLPKIKPAFPENNLLVDPKTSQKFFETSLSSKPSFQILQKKNKKVGYFPIDATFSPVTRVNYLIESNDLTELKEKPHFFKESILLEIWTNGSIHPRQAIHKAAKSLIQLFLPLQQMQTFFFSSRLKKAFLEKAKTLTLGQKREGERKTNRVKKLVFLPNPPFEKENTVEKKVTSKRVDLEKKNPKKGDKSKKKKPMSPKLAYLLLDLDIANLELTAKTYCSLKMANINILQDLLAYSKKELLLIKNFSSGALIEVEESLQKLNLNLK